MEWTYLLYIYIFTEKVGARYYAFSFNIFCVKISKTAIRGTRVTHFVNYAQADHGQIQAINNITGYRSIQKQSIDMDFSTVIHSRLKVNIRWN